MELVLDAKRAFMNATGLGQYARSHLRMLASMGMGSQLTLLSPRSIMPSFEREMEEVGARVRFLGGGLGWRASRLPKQANASGAALFHALSPEVPSGLDMPVVATFHDLIPFENSSYHRFHDVWLYRLKIVQTLHRAKKMVSVSERTALILKERFPKMGKEVRVLPPVFVPDPAWESVGPKVFPRPFVLYVGSHDLRKNLGTLLRAYALGESRHLPDLVVIGPFGSATRSWREFVRNMQLDQKIHFMGGVSEAEKAAWYKACLGLVYPSLLEGFGLPILEGLYFRKPVFTSLGTVMEEAGGSFVHYLNPLDPGAWANALEGLGKERPVPKEGIAAWLAQFSPEMLGPKWMQLYLETV